MRRAPWPSLVWAVPLVAVLVGLSMLFHAWRTAGPRVTITFQVATGLEAGKTPIKYKDVIVGTVSAIRVSHDGSHVIVSAALERSAANLVHADTRFWVVRPRLGVGGVSGIDTLVSGSYIGMDMGTDGPAPQVYRGLESPPTVLHGTPGKSFVLHAEDLGSLDIGSPVYYRRIQVGRVSSYWLEPDGQHVTLQVFVDAPYDRFVTTATHFWNASGIDVSLGADGLKLNTQSIATLVAGGVAFADTADAHARPAPAQTVYELAKDQQTALAPPDGPAVPIQLRFNQALRGLAVGAEVEFAGVNAGQVTAIQLDYDTVRHRFASLVRLDIYPSRLGPVTARLAGTGNAGDPQQQVAGFLADMVDHGLRAQARSANLLTGQLYIEIAFTPNAPRVAFNTEARPLSIPTTSGDFDQMQRQAGEIIAKIDRMPLESIGKRLDDSLAGLNQTLKQINGQMLPQTTGTLQDIRRTLNSLQSGFGDSAPLQQNLNHTLEELNRAARSARALTDFLGRHPDALLKGVPADPAPASQPEPAK